MSFPKRRHAFSPDCPFAILPVRRCIIPFARPSIPHPNPGIWNTTITT
ncbi:MAG TPA: hypothetical protein VFQ30_01410 [Ktedonobacteraceae bacterium]|nr:hypothetical protein [Ktedonobacteraceae bacterium]